MSSDRSEEHTSELQSLRHLVCRLLLEKKNKNPARPSPVSGAFSFCVHSAGPPGTGSTHAMAATSARCSGQPVGSPALPSFFLKDTRSAEITPLPKPGAPRT